MDDSKLLELAGLASGETYTQEHNPLERDDLALRLAVKLGITIGPESSDVIGKSLCRASWNNQSMSLGEFGSGDPYAAIRRAIVRAAAEIGRQHEHQ